MRRLMILVIAVGMLFAGTVLATEMDSSNFHIEYSSIDSGGVENQISSSGYEMTGSLGEVGSLQLENASYRLEGGLAGGSRNNTPDQPVLSNPDEYYDRLNLIIDNGDNPDDVLFAIAISSDNWTTTNYVQDNHSVGSSLGVEDWATYAGWGGGSGFDVLGLGSNTSYKVKVMALETEFGPESAEVSTDEPYITFSSSGVGSGVLVEGQTTDVGTGANWVDFGNVAYDNRLIAASHFSIVTNSLGGYSMTTRQSGNMVNVGGDDIDKFPDGNVVSCNNGSPCGWVSPSEGAGEDTWGHFGYHTSDDSLGTGTADRFLDDDTYCAFEEVDKEVGYSGISTTSGDETYIVYSLEVSNVQANGDYSNSLTFIVTGKY